MLIRSSTSNADGDMTWITVHFTLLVVMRGTSRVEGDGFLGLEFNDFVILAFTS
jgi:hypothetical protein